jgi:hypothetical protein
MTKALFSIALATLVSMSAAVGELLVHEAFDYAPVNDPVGGRLAGKTGGLGFNGPWVNSSGDNLGLAFIYDSRGNPDALYGGSFGGGQPDWDGVVNNLPTRGGYAGLSDWSNQANASEDKWNSHRPLAMSAGEMAGPDGVLWLSAVWHWPGSSLQNRPGIALTNGGHFSTARSEFLSNNGFGMGVGNGNIGGWPTAVLNPTIWNNGSEVAQTGASSMTLIGDHVIILKFQFGAVDKVSAWSFTENHPLTEAAFNANATSVSHAIDEFKLNTLVFGAHRKETAIDEFRIGTTFQSVTTEAVVPRQPFEITEILRDPETGDVTLSWRSNPGELYGLQWSPDLKTFYPGISQSVPAHAVTRLTTFGPFPSPLPQAGRLFFRVGPADITPPSLLAMGGSGNRIVITFSEPMLPGSATDPANYLLEMTGGGVIGILSASIGDKPNTVVLTLASSIEEGSSYSVKVSNVTDPAGLSILANSRIGFTAWGGPVITEFMASSGSNMYQTEVLLDEDGESPDWIEIFNPTADTVNLGGWHLTDNAGNLTKWPIPALPLAPGDRLIVFASGKDRRAPGGELHTNFSLAADGEYLALVRPPGEGLATEFSPTFPPQVRGISYGLLTGSATDYRYFGEPTPGFPNAASGFFGVTGGIQFSMDRGFYDSPFNTDLACATPDVTIRYTLDMSEPSLSNGLTHTSGSPIQVSSTTAIRARAFKPGWLPGSLDTRTYIFPAAVFTQPANPPGFPSSWGGYAAMYEMKSSVTSRYTTAELEAALKSLPAISIVTETPNLFDSSIGIYANRLEKDELWERPASMEWIDPNGGPEIQLNCGLRLQGGAARLFPKKPFRLLFKGMYGPTSLDFPVFSDSSDAVKSFDTLILRANSQDRIWGAIMQVTDEHGRRTLMDMGNPQSHGTYVHLFVNGLYWGLYNPVERPQASFAADYYGGTKDEWDVNNGNEAIDGSYTPFDAMLAQVRGGPPTDAAYQKIQGKAPDGTPDPASPGYLDMPNYVDYMLANFYLGTGDWAGNVSQGTRNYYCGRRRIEESPGYQWFIWDAERSLQTSIPTGVIYGPAEPYAWLKNNAEFRLLFADHAQRHLRNGGALTSGRRQPVFTALADRIRPSIKLDEARWDQTTVDGFETHIASRTAWFPNRADTVLNHFRNQGLFPLTDAPVFSPHGGQVAAETPVSMTTDADTIYYTLDGSDPRLLGGAVSPSALAATFGGGAPVPVTYMSTGHVWRYLDNGSNQGTAWRATAFNDTTWSAGPSQLGYGSNNEGSGTAVSFGPDASNKYITTYFRTTVNIPDPAAWNHFLMRIKYDDGVAVYVNGSEVVRANLAADAAYNTMALSNVANEDQWKDFTVATSAFAPGINTIAVEIHQVTAASSDIRLDMTLRGEPASGGGANVSDPLFFAQATTLKARSYNSVTREWSAHNEAFFRPLSEPATSANLVISEIHYHPADPSTPEELAVTSDKNDFEFIELQNIGDTALDLTGVAFTRGITFVFPPGGILPAGARVVLVQNLAAFTARYGSLAPGAVAGVFSGRLDNGGERLTLLGAGGVVIRDFAYSDLPPWPTTPDGFGYSLVLLNPESNPDPALAASWAASATIGGTPGAAD